jgi:hypothetical protein
MASAALKKITTKAKKIYKRGGTWRQAIKKAGAEYRSGKLGKVVRMKTRRRATTKKRKRIVKKIRRLHRAEGRAIRSLGTVAGIKSQLKKRLKEKLAKGMLSHYEARTKPQKKRISKRLTVIKRELKNLS